MIIRATITPNIRVVELELDPPEGVLAEAVEVDVVPEEEVGLLVVCPLPLVVEVVVCVPLYVTFMSEKGESAPWTPADGPSGP